MSVLLSVGFLSVLLAPGLFLSGPWRLLFGCLVVPLSMAGFVVFGVYRVETARGGDPATARGQAARAGRRALVSLPPFPKDWRDASAQSGAATSPVDAAGGGDLDAVVTWPVVIVEGHDVQVLARAESVAREVEHYDVDDPLFVVFDSAGRRVELSYDREARRPRVRADLAAGAEGDMERFYDALWEAVNALSHFPEPGPEGVTTGALGRLVDYAGDVFGVA